jgi:DNA invertase Pin-like site-specific DNA recombinase
VARSTADFSALLDRADKRGWKIVLLDVDVDTTTAAGRLVVDVVAAAAQFESKRIGERVRDTHAVRRAQGKRAGQPPILPQPVRDRIYAEHLAGRSLSQIARDLDADGIPTAKGGRWWPYTVSHVIESVKLDYELAALAG